MKKMSIKKLTFLGLTLTVISAITAAVLPAKPKSNTALVLDGVMGRGTGWDSAPNQWTCKPRAGAPNCHNSVSGLDNLWTGETGKGILGVSISNGTTDNDLN